MSWDLFVMRLPDGVEDFDHLPSDFAPDVMGTRAEIVDAIRGVVPSADLSNPTWVLIDDSAYSIEVSIPEDPVRSFTFSARGTEAAIAPMIEIIERLGATAFDPQSDGGAFTAASATATFRRWREYRDRHARES